MATCENQKVLCPLLQIVVPFVHGAFLASIFPIGGCFPPEKAGVRESMEFPAQTKVYRISPQLPCLHTGARRAKATLTHEWRSVRTIMWKIEWSRYVKVA